MLLAPGGALAADIVSYAIVQDDAKLKVQRKRLRLFGVYPVELSPFCDDIFCPARCQARAAVALASKIQGVVTCTPKIQYRGRHDRRVSAMSTAAACWIRRSSSAHT